METVFKRQDSLQSPQEAITPLPPHEMSPAKRILHPIVVRVLNDLKPMSPGHIAKDRTQPREGVILLKTVRKHACITPPLTCVEKPVTLNIISNPLLMRRKVNSSVNNADKK